MKFSGSEQAEMVLKIHKPRTQKIVELFYSEVGGNSPQRMSSRKGSKRQIIPEDEHLNVTGAIDTPEWLQECLNVYQTHKHTSQKGSIQEVRAGILGLSVNIGLFIVQAQTYFQNGISKLLTASLSKLLAEIKHTENDTTTFTRLSLLKPEFSEKPEQLSQLTDLLGDMLYCFYAIMDTLLSQRDLRGKILNDETITVGLASAAASHLASDFLSSISGILDSFLQ